MKLNQFLVGLACVLSLWAAITNMRAARIGYPAGRVLCAMRSTLAFVYTGAYLFLYFHPADRLQWSYIVQGVSIPVWLIVWRQPAVVSLRLAKESAQESADKG